MRKRGRKRVLRCQRRLCVQRAKRQLAHGERHLIVRARLHQRGVVGVQPCGDDCGRHHRGGGGAAVVVVAVGVVG